MAETETSLGRELQLREASLGGEERQGLPVVEEGFEPPHFEETRELFVGFAARPPLVLGFEAGRGADQSRRGEQTRMADEEADGEASAEGVAGEVETARTALAEAAGEAVDLVFEADRGDGTAGIMAEEVATEDLGPRIPARR
jgi:hypothetical protein